MRLKTVERDPHQCGAEAVKTIAIAAALAGFQLSSLCLAAPKPIIGINMEMSGETTSPRLSLAGDYVDAVTSAGGIPVLLPATNSLTDVKRQVALCDGFVFTGGRDINAQRYGAEPHPANRLLHTRRENFDFELANQVLESKKPFLAVCLGCQEMNVALGGTLIQDIPTETSSTLDHHQGETRHETAHAVQISTSSKLNDLVGTTTLAVNSVHHQSCGVPGKGVRYTAFAPDGIVEGYELEKHRFGVAVQWHPESLADRPEHLKLYEGLVRAAAQGDGTAKKQSK